MVMAEDVGGARRSFYRAGLEAAAAELGPSFRVPEVGERGQQTFRSGPFGAYWLWFSGDGLRVVAYIDSRGGDATINRRIIDDLRTVVPKLEAAAGHPVTVDVDE